MKHGILAAATAASLLLAGLALATGTALAYPENATGSDTMTSSTGEMEDWTAMMDNMTMTSADHMNAKWGVISSIQNDEQGEPAWVVAGHFMMKEGDSSTETAGTTNSTGNTTTAATISNVTEFSAMLHMAMLDGSAMHMHEVSNFTQTGDAATSGNSTTITGTATVTMREGPVNDVPTEITISQGKVVAIEFDPASIDNHFGDTPVYGMLVDMEMMMGWMEMHHGDMMGSWMDKGNTTTSSTEGYMME